MSEIKFYKHEQIPMEMHKVKIVQQLTLLPAKERAIVRSRTFPGIARAMANQRG